MNVSSRQKRLGLGKVVAAAIFANPVRLLGAMVGKKTELVCQDCGYKWIPYP